MSIGASFINIETQGRKIYDLDHYIIMIYVIWFALILFGIEREFSKKGRFGEGLLLRCNSVQSFLIK